MSAATKRKHVVNSLRDDLLLPKDGLFVVKVIGGRGNNLHQVEGVAGEKYLASMPTKFRRNVWIKRGDYLLCEKINEGDKVQAEIVHILYKDNIKYIRDEGLWPDQFSEAFASNASKCDALVDMLPPSCSSSDSNSDSDQSSCNSSCDEDCVRHKSRKSSGPASAVRNPNRGRLFGSAGSTSKSTPRKKLSGKVGAVSWSKVRGEEDVGGCRSKTRIDSCDDSDSTLSNTHESADEADTEDNVDDKREPISVSDSCSSSSGQFSAENDELSISLTAAEITTSQLATKVNAVKMAEK